tara:strand:+ start:597 stop:899 length:303 start_codon:yes stop_codon:yes gene_type:complete
MTSIINAIIAINPNAEVSVNGENIDTIQWHNETAEISKSDILAKQAELQTAYDAKNYQRNREIAYPKIQEQLDMQYWDNVNGTTTWKDAIAKVKSDNPKT